LSILDNHKILEGIKKLSGHDKEHGREIEEERKERKGLKLNMKRHKNLIKKCFSTNKKKKTKK